MKQDGGGGVMFRVGALTLKHQNWTRRVIHWSYKTDGRGGWWRVSSRCCQCAASVDTRTQAYAAAICSWPTVNIGPVWTGCSLLLTAAHHVISPGYTRRFCCCSRSGRNFGCSLFWEKAKQTWKELLITAVKTHKTASQSPANSHQTSCLSTRWSKSASQSISVSSAPTMFVSNADTSLMKTQHCCSSSKIPALFCFDNPISVVTVGRR